MTFKITSEDDDNFDFSGFPKLGRPFKSGLPRDKYVKYYLTADELKAFEDLQKKVSAIYQNEGYAFNAPEYFRMFMKFYDHPTILRLFFADYELQGIKKHDFDSFDLYMKELKNRKK